MCPIKSTRCTAHANFRASGSASKLSKDACLLAGYSCTLGLENKHWISAFPIQTLLQPVAKVLETLSYFGLNDPPMILCLWSPLLPLSKMLAIQDHAQNIEEQLWMEGRREVSIIFQVKKVSFSLECLNIFALGCSPGLLLPCLSCQWKVICLTNKIHLGWINGWDLLSPQLTYRGLLTEGIQQTCEHQLWMRRKNPHHLQEQPNIVKGR